MTNSDLVVLLKRYDKHLWGINATYSEAARIIGIAKSSAVKRALWQFRETAFDAQKQKSVGHYDWRGNVDWYKHPDRASGPKKATKGVALGRKSWDRLKQFFAEKRELIESEGSTMEFVIRLFRSYHPPANAHIVTELLALKKVTLKGVAM